MASVSAHASTVGTAVVKEDQQETPPPDIVSSAMIDPECDIVLAWLQRLCDSPSDGDEEIRLPLGDPSETPDEFTTAPSMIESSRATLGGSAKSISSPPSPEYPAKDASIHRLSEAVEPAFYSLLDDEGDKEAVDQNLANIAAIELLNSCYTLPAEFFAASRGCHQRHSSFHDSSSDQAPYMISSLSMQCYHCSFPTGLARPHSHAGPPWRNGFDGPSGGSSSEPPTEDSSKVPPTPNSMTRPADSDAVLKQKSSLQDIGKYHWFRHGRKRRFPRVLHVTECSHPDDDAAAAAAAAAADAAMKTESDTGESSGPDISKAPSASGSVPDNESHRSKTKHMKDVVSKKIHSLGQKLHVSSPDPRPSSAGHTPFRSPTLKPRHLTEMGSLALTKSHSLPDAPEAEGVSSKPVVDQADLSPTTVERVDKAHEAGGSDKSEPEDGEITLTDKDGSPPKCEVLPNTPASVASAGTTTPAKSPTIPWQTASPTLWVPPNTPQSAAERSPQMHGLARLPSASKSSLSRSSTNDDGGERVFKLTPVQETHDHRPLHIHIPTPEEGASPRDASPRDASPRDAARTTTAHAPSEDDHIAPHPTHTPGENHHPALRPILSHPLPPPPPPSSEGAASTPSPSSTNRRVSFDVKETPDEEQHNHAQAPKRADPPTETPSTTCIATSTSSLSPVEDKTPPGRIRNWPSSLAASSPGTLGTRPSVTSTSSSPGRRRQSDFVHDLHHHHHHHHVGMGDIDTHNLRRHSDVTNLVSKRQAEMDSDEDDDEDDDGDGDDDDDRGPESEEEDGDGDWGREPLALPRPRAASLVAEMETLWWDHYHAQQRGEVDEEKDEDYVWEGIPQPAVTEGVPAQEGRRRSSGTVRVLEKIESGESSDAGDGGEEEYFPCRSRKGSEGGADGEELVLAETPLR